MGDLSIFRKRFCKVSAVTVKYMFYLAYTILSMYCETPNTVFTNHGVPVQSLEGVYGIHNTCSTTALVENNSNPRGRALTQAQD